MPSDESEVFDFAVAEAEGDRTEAARCGGVNECIRDKTSIFSSFSSNRSFKSFTSLSRDLTRSSSDSVYPRGKARRLNLSLVRHSKPTLAHCEQQGRTPSQRIFLLRHRSQAWAIRLVVPVPPTLITFIGKIPGMLCRRGTRAADVKFVVFGRRQKCKHNTPYKIIDSKIMQLKKSPV